MNKKRKIIIVIVQFMIAVMLFVFGEFAPVTREISTAGFALGYGVLTVPMIYYAIVEFKKKNFINNYFIVTVATGILILLGNYQQSVLSLFIFSLLFQVVEYIKEKRMEKIVRLERLLPTETAIFIEGKETVVGVENLKSGNIVIVKEGEMIPGDGRVFTGSAYIDISSLKGNRKIVQVYKGSIVFGGTINRKGILQVELIGNPQNSLVYRLTNRINKSQNSRGYFEEKVRKIFNIFKPICLIGAVITAVGIPFFMGDLYTPWILKGITILFIASVDSIVSSLSLSTSSLIYDLYIDGVIVKDIHAVENFSEIEAVVIDKKLSLGEGGYFVTKIEDIEGSKEEILTLAAHLEHFSKHPVAMAIVDGFIQLAKYEGIIEKNPINPHVVRKFEEIEGKGVTGYVGGNFVCVGNHELMNILNIKEIQSGIKNKRVHVAINQKYYGYIQMEYRREGDSEDIYAIWRNAGIKKCGIAGNNFSDIIKELKTVGCEKKRIAFISEDELQEDNRRKIGTYISINALNNSMSRESADIFVMDNSFKKVAKIKTYARDTIAKIKNKFWMGCLSKFAVYSIGAILGMQLYSLIAIDGVITLILNIETRK